MYLTQVNMRKIETGLVTMKIVEKDTDTIVALEKFQSGDYKGYNDKLDKVFIEDWVTKSSPLQSIDMTILTIKGDIMKDILSLLQEHQEDWGELALQVTWYQSAFNF